ncbi:MAG: hypothetical protein KGR26_00105 [Cyanobacteria bacterium REEB65]|nr:hypothetical protein [Cyanobacteria bacterium REEB65]
MKSDDFFFSLAPRCPAMAARRQIIVSDPGAHHSTEYITVRTITEKRKDHGQPAKSPKAMKVVRAHKKGEKRRPRKRQYTFASYIYKVLKEVHEAGDDPELSISRKSMAVLDSFVLDLEERIAREASRLARYNGRRTITSREIASACRLLLPGELARHAMSEGTKSLLKFEQDRKASE